MKLQNRWLKILLGVVGTVLVGAVGSGVWDLGGRRVSLWLAHLLFTAITLGSSALRDSVYQEAARGLHEGAALQEFTFVACLVLGAAGFWAGFLDGQVRGEKDMAEESRRLDRLVANLPEEEARVKLKDELDRLKANLRRSKARFRRSIKVAVLLGGTIVIFNVAKLSVANRIFTIYTQTLTVCSPYLSSQQRDLFNSRFAQMNGRENYLAIMTDLRTVASARHLSVPTDEGL